MAGTYTYGPSPGLSSHLVRVPDPAGPPVGAARRPAPDREIKREGAGRRPRPTTAAATPHRREGGRGPPGGPGAYRVVHTCWLWLAHALSSFFTRHLGDRERAGRAVVLPRPGASHDDACTIWSVPARVGRSGWGQMCGSPWCALVGRTGRSLVTHWTKRDGRGYRRGVTDSTRVRSDAPRWPVPNGCTPSFAWALVPA
ncbi:hypothetical protein BS78_03G390000 [Paspalum vaginatum]|nr:hypothetical protein BS78_03G390000 [Paspalum vaginatum]